MLLLQNGWERNVQTDAKTLASPLLITSLIFDTLQKVNIIYNLCCFMGTVIMWSNYGVILFWYVSLYFLEIQKVLTKLSKERGCEIIGRWQKACLKHFYWAVTSTQERLGEVKLAKFQAFLHHVINQNTDPPNRLFNACAHGDILTPRVWMYRGTL